MLQIFTKNGCRTGSQRNSFLYADKEKKLPFILKKKDIRINRNMTAKELKIGTPVALQKKYVFWFLWAPVIQQKHFVTRGFWVRRYAALVVSAPIPLRTQLARAPTRRKAFLLNYGAQKNQKLTTFHFNDILLSINFHEGVASVYDTYQVNILTEWSGLF